MARRLALEGRDLGFDQPAVDPRTVRDVVENRLGDLLAFVAEIRRRLAQA